MSHNYQQGRDKLLNHWMRFNQDYLQYVLNVLFNGGLVTKITLQTFEYPKHVMFRGKADAQRDLLFKMLEKTTGKTINYRMLAIYLGHLVQMFVETNGNLAVFWTRYTVPVQRYKTELFVESWLEKLARFKGTELDLRRNKALFTAWMKHNSVLHVMHRGVFQHIYSPHYYHPVDPVHPRYRMKPCILDSVDIIWLNHQLAKPLDHSWTLLYRANMNEDSLDTLAAAIEKKGHTLLVIKDMNGNVFGGYTSSMWRRSCQYNGSDNCFLFRLDPDYKILKCARSEAGTKSFSYLNTTQAPGLGIGGPLGQCGLWLDEIFGRGYCSAKCLDFQYGPLLEEEAFVAEQIQVWSVGDTSVQD